MPRHFVSFRVQQMQPSPVCEYFAKGPEGIKLTLSGPQKGEKLKKLEFLREIKNGLIVEKFQNFYIMSSFENAQFFVPEFYEYDELKATLAYGLKAGSFGISAVLALRIFLYFLLANDRFYDAIKLLKICPESIVENQLCDKIKDPIDILAIVMDNEGNYLKTTSAALYYSTLIRLLLTFEKKLPLILEFASFFKAHKKAKTKEGVLKLLKKVNNV